MILECSQLCKSILLSLALLCFLALPAFASQEDEASTSILPDRTPKLKPGSYYKEPYVATVMAVVLQADQEVLVAGPDMISVGAGTQTKLNVPQALELLKNEKKKDFLRIAVFDNETNMKVVDEIIEMAGYKRVVVIGCSAFHTKVLKDVSKEETAISEGISKNAPETDKLLPGYYTFSERLHEKAPVELKVFYDTAKWAQICRTAEKADKWLNIKGADWIEIGRDGKDKYSISEILAGLAKESKKDFLTIAISKDYLMDVNVWTQAHEIMNRSGYKRVLLLGYSDWAMIVFEDRKMNIREVKLSQHSTGEIVVLKVGKSPARKYFEKQRIAGNKFLKTLSLLAVTDNPEVLNLVENKTKPQELDLRLYSPDEIEVCSKDQKKHLTKKELTEYIKQLPSRNLAFVHIAKMCRGASHESDIEMILPFTDSLKFKRVLVKQDSAYFNPLLLDKIYQFEPGLYCSPDGSVELAELFAETIGSANEYLQVFQPDQIVIGANGKKLQNQLELYEKSAQASKKDLLVVALMKTGEERNKLLLDINPTIANLGYKRVLTVSPHPSGCIVLKDETSN